MAIGTEQSEFTDWILSGVENYQPHIARGVVVEIGGGGVPIPAISHKIAEKIKRGGVYVDVDVTFESSLVHNAGTFIKGDLKRLPLASGIADQIWLRNVFGNMFESVILESDWDPKEQKYESVSLFRRYLNELNRVLKPEGTIYIGEDNTPADWLLRENYADFGLEAEIFMHQRYWEFANTYGMKKYSWKWGCGDPSSEPFFMTLRRKKDLTTDHLP